MSGLPSPAVSRIGNTGPSFVCNALAFHGSPFEFRCLARLFNAARFLFSVTTGTFAKGCILFLTQSTVARALCSGRSKSLQEWSNTRK
jgi:hypothetical protein